jgi:predicted  nucleic acid-binding Zn-ribbon protein
VTEGVKLQDLQIGALQRKLDEGNGRLKQQQTLYDAVKADRATYKKNLLAAHSEISDMKRSFDVLKASIESVKDEITGKDAALVREHSEHARVDREKVSRWCTSPFPSSSRSFRDFNLRNNML